jgi:DNA-binding transcriptional MerR regulator
MYKMGEFSKRAQVTPKMLRGYEHAEVLLPVRTDEQNGYKYYNISQVEKVLEIRALLDIGFTLNEIKIILKQKNQFEMMNMKQKTLEDELALIENKIKLIQFYKKAESLSFSQKYKATVKIIPQERIISKCMKNASVFDIINEYDRLLNQPFVKDIPLQSLCYMTIFYNDEYSEENSDVELCIRMGGEILSCVEMESRVIPETNVISVMHKGSYNLLREAYTFIYMCIDESRYEVDGHPREIYWKAYGNCNNEEDYITELQIPIKKH